MLRFPLQSVCNCPPAKSNLSKLVLVTELPPDCLELHLTELRAEMHRNLLLTLNQRIAFLVALFLQLPPASSSSLLHEGIYFDLKKYLCFIKIGNAMQLHMTR